jgi:N-acyl-D-amino-acid deacylase
MRSLFFLLAVLFFFSCKQEAKYETIIRHGMIYDGNGGEPYKADIAINADTIALIGDLSKETAKNEIDANGMAVAPGFINMLSWSNSSLIEDGRSQGELRQGVTLEVMGEGESMGPLNAKMKEQLKKGQHDIKYNVEWNTLGEYLSWLEKKGISCNVASFVGATTVREYVVGEDDRAPTPAQMDSMKLLVRQAMEEGAMGVGSSLIYPPAFFAKTNELTELCKEASKYNGMYISHIRDEGNKLFEAVDELMTISKEANLPAEIYHFKLQERITGGRSTAL